jgi:hypothetical protein
MAQPACSSTKAIAVRMVAHERIRVRDFYQGVEFYDRFIRALGSQP